MKTKIKYYLSVIFFLVSQHAFSQTVPAVTSAACAYCGVDIQSGQSHKKGCPYYSASSVTRSSNKTSYEQDILMNIFSNVLTDLLSNKGPSKQDIEKARLAEEQRQIALAVLLARQKHYNDSMAQVNHDRMMKDYKKLDGSGELTFKSLDEDTWKPSVHFNCKILAYKGSVTVLKSNGQKIILSETQSVDLAPGDWIATGQNSRLKLHYAFETGGEDLVLGSNSAINIVTNEEGSHIPKLLKGDMYVVNNKLKEELADKVLDTKEELAKDVDQLMVPIKKKFSKKQIRTPSAICGIRGTEFTVHVDEFDNTEVNVKNGIVDLTGNLSQGVITLTAGTKGIVKGTGEILGPLTFDEKMFDNWNQNW